MKRAGYFADVALLRDLPAILLPERTAWIMPPCLFTINNQGHARHIAALTALE